MGERLTQRIPEPTVLRLPLYQRRLVALWRAGVPTVSSAELAEATGLNAAKVRKDLSYLGTYGTPGTGYDVTYLLGKIDTALGLDRDWPVAIVGIGNLGRALARSHGFTSRGVRVAALFDVDAAKIGEQLGECTIRRLDELEAVAASTPLTLGVITTPPDAAQDVADRLVAVGVTAILNFAPTVLSVPANVLLRHVDLSAELQVLTFYQSKAAQTGVAKPAAS